MSAKAKLISKTDSGHFYEIDWADFSIGRSKECAVILHDPLVSRLHARIYFEGDRYIIENSGKNPTLINGIPIYKQDLENGDLISIGSEEFLFRIENESADISGHFSDNGQTVILTSAPAESARPNLSIVTSLGHNLTFNLDKDSYLIGRRPDCDIPVDDDMVSRRHAEVYFDGRNWCVRDLNSGNGTFLDGARIENNRLSGHTNLQLGAGGPSLFLKFVGVSMGGPERPDTVHDIEKHYFSDTSPAAAGEHTIMVRRAFQEVKQRQTKRYVYVITGIAVLLIISSGVGLYNYMKLRKARTIAVDIFYNMKALSLQVANIEDRLREIGESKILEEEIIQKKDQLTSLEEQYDRFIKESGILDIHMSKEDQIIYNIARMFGECEVNMPDAFKREIKKYIKKWQKSKRLPKAIRRLELNNYAPVITEIMKSNGLAPHFLYLALQESDFRKKAVGPRTRHGIAKGIWQFIPSTASDYGLRIGPLANRGVYDPEDERFNFEAATRAAGKFLRDIYKTDAQASGLLVMASYNWGPTAVKKRIRRMPENPKERNFWKLITDYKIPKETNDYVFYIFSAAVIGENPELFGFDFKNPLGALVKKSSA